MDEFYQELYVIYFRKWIFQKQNKTCKVYADPSDQDTLLLENENSLGRVTFNQYLIIELSIQNKKTSEIEFYLHFQMKNLNHTLKFFNEMFKYLNKNNDIPIQKILLICSGGLTTGYFVEKLNETAHLLKVNACFQAVGIEKIEEISKNFDILLLAPQVSYYCAPLQNKFKNQVILKIPTSIFATYDAIKLIDYLKTNNKCHLKTL